MEQNEYATIRINGQVCLEADFVRPNVTFEEKHDYVIASGVPIGFYLRCSG